MFKIYTSFHDKNGSKTIPFGAAHTYIAYIGEYPLGACKSVSMTLPVRTAALQIGARGTNQKREFY